MLHLYSFYGLQVLVGEVGFIRRYLSDPEVLCGSLYKRDEVGPVANALMQGHGKVFIPVWTKTKHSIYVLCNPVKGQRLH
jgi:hypothetical protein